MTVIGMIIIIFGLLFSAFGSVGAIRLPDFFTRAHAIGVLDTIGTLLIVVGLQFIFGFSLVSAKLLILLVFIYIANPTITHVFVRAAIKSGLEPWAGKTKEENK